MTGRHRISILAAGLFAVANFGFATAAEPICVYPGANELCVITDTQQDPEAVVGVTLTDANGVHSGAGVAVFCNPHTGTTWTSVIAGVGGTFTELPVNTGQAC